MLRAALLAIALAALGASSARAATLDATPANFEAVFAAAAGGDVIRLASGDYGEFDGGAKPATVTIVPQPGASATIAPSFSNASNIRFEGLTIRELLFTGTTNNVSVAGSRFTGLAVVRADEMVNANILFEGNIHENIDVCGNCYEGRMEVVGDGPGPAGVTIRNSRFGPGGEADGIQLGARGVKVIGNEFTGLRVIGDVHTDSLQLYGADETLIQGNWFHDNDVAIMAPDGGRGNTVIDNVFEGDEYRPAIQLGSQRDVTFAHNTVRDIDVFVDKKDESPTPSVGVVRDNIVLRGKIHSPASDCTCTVDNNLFSRSGDRDGTRAILGTPVFAGGANPSSYAGFALAERSVGKGRATDGSDLGIRVTPPAQLAPPAAAPLPGGQGRSPAATTRTAQRRGRKLTVPRTITWRQLRRGFPIKVTAPRRSRVALRLWRKGTRRVLLRTSRRMTRRTKTFTIRAARRARLGRPRAQTLRLRATIRRKGTRTVRLRADIRVRR